MGIFNKRNALLGWGVWKFAKRAGRRKAREVVPGTGEHAGLNKSAIASIGSAIAAFFGALWFWRKKSDQSAPKPSG